MLSGKKISFIGGGVIAESLIGGIIKAGLVEASQITISDISQERLKYMHNKYAVNIASVMEEAVRGADLLFLTVKPYVIPSVLAAISKMVATSTVVVSVAAGITLEALQSKLLRVPVIRVMPNTPVAVGEGMSAVALGAYASEENGQLVLAIFCAVGKAVILEESAMDAVTGLSGSGPGYAFVLIDALSDAGVRVGLSRQHSLLMAAQTLLGAAKMVIETGEHPARLRDMVTTPGGTTIAGIHSMEKSGVRAALIDAVQAATLRSQEMGKKNK